MNSIGAHDAIVNVFASNAVDLSSSPGRVKPRTIKLVFAASLLKTCII